MNGFLANTPGGNVTPIIIWSLVLIGVMVAAFVLVIVVKKWLSQPREPQPGTGGGFTLSDLRRLHRNGEISDAEFEKAKSRIIDVAKTGPVQKMQTPTDGS